MSFEELLDLLEHTGVTLAAECTKNDSVERGVFCFLDLLGANHSHLFGLVDLMGQLLLEGIVLIEFEV